MTLTDVASRAGVHYSAVRRYFTSHKEVLLHLAAEGWVRWSDTVCEKLRDARSRCRRRGSPRTLADGLAADPLFCDLLANLHLHLEHEVEIDRVLEVKQISTAAVTSLADAIEHALPGLGRPGAFDVILAAYSLAAPLWQVANPPKKLADAYAEAKATDLPPDWNIDFTSALTRLITATCVGLMAEPRGVQAGLIAAGCDLPVPHRHVAGADSSAQFSVSLATTPLLFQKIFMWLGQANHSPSAWGA